MPTQKRLPTKRSLDTLRGLSLRQTGAGPSPELGLMPVVFNGEERFALVAFYPEDSGVHIRVLAIMPAGTDTILGGDGVKLPIEDPPSLNAKLN